MTVKRTQGKRSMPRPHNVRPRRGAVSVSSIALIAVAAACATLVVKHRAATARANEIATAAAENLATAREIVARTPSSQPSAPTVEQAVGNLHVRDAAGNVVPLVTKGEPAIIMVSSVTCQWCKKSLKDLGEIAAGRPLPRLKFLTLEGAADGAPMLAKEHITGAQLIGPSGGRDQVMLTFRYPGTPTFLAVDREGHVVGTMPGYPMREVMKQWFAVMVGDRDVP